MARGGRPGGRGGNRAPLTRAVQVSKKLSWLLRHGAEKEGLKLGEGGYINVGDVLANRNLRSLQITFDEVKGVVAADEKQRYTMIPASEDGSGTVSDRPEDYLIRANQGHSLKLEDEGLLTPITKDNMPGAAVHGTTHAAWSLIAASRGLKAMTRNHVHFAAGLPAGFRSVVEQDASVENAAPVISGMRNSSTVLVFLDLAKAMDAGLKFGLSDNGVVLTEGNENGLVPLEFFKRVEDRTGEGILVEDGQIVKEAPASWSKGKGKG